MFDRKIATAVSITSLGIVLSGTAVFANSKTGTVTADALHVRSGPSTNYSKITKVYQGQTVSIIESSNGWHKIKTPSGHVGWSSGEFINLSGESANGGNNNNSNSGSNTDNSLTGKKATITASALNVRSGPSTGYNIIGTTYQGNTVEIITSSNGWHKVKLSNGQVGWISGQYVSLSGDAGNSG
ncbi:MAG: SH3 domain-containing protein, partial [Paeniclostridium sordellii]|nr:SH3 domain-containing protein [Paeniclostridium sordellii]